MKKLTLTFNLIIILIGYINGQETKDYSLYFDGNDQVIIPHSNLISISDNSEFTIELWFKNTGDRSTYHIFGKRNDCGHTGLNYQLARDGNSRLHFGSCYDVLSNNQDPTKNEWTHYAVTYKNNIAKVYLNGKQIIKTSFSMCGSNTVPFKLGTSGTCGSYMNFIGYIDEFRFWKTARDSNEIAFFFNKYINNKSPDLISYWSFNEDSTSQIINDFSINENYGCLGADTLIKSDDPVRVVSTLNLSNNHDIELISIEGIDSLVNVNDTVLAEIYVRNNSLTTETFDLTFILDVFQRNNKFLTLKPGEIEKISFPAFIPKEIGIFKYYANVICPTDSFKSNNTISSDFSVNQSNAAPTILGVIPKNIGCQTPSTLTLSGFNFNLIKCVLLVQDTDTIEINSEQQVLYNSTKINILAEFGNNQIGNWDIMLLDTNNNKYYYKNAFQVEIPKNFLKVDIIGRKLVRENRTYNYTLRVSNSGNAPIYLPYLFVRIPIEISNVICSQNVNCYSDLNINQIDAGKIQSLITLELPSIMQNSFYDVSLEIKIPLNSSNFRLEATASEDITDFTKLIQNKSLSPKTRDNNTLKVKSTQSIVNGTCQPNYPECTGSSIDCIKDYPYDIQKTNNNFDYNTIPKNRVYRILWRENIIGLHEGYIYNDTIYWCFDKPRKNGVQSFPIKEIKEWEESPFVGIISIKRPLPHCATNYDHNELVKALRNSEAKFANYKFSGISSEKDQTLHCSGYTIRVNRFLDEWLYNRTKRYVNGECQYGGNIMTGYETNHQVTKALNYWAKNSENFPDECDNKDDDDLIPYEDLPDNDSVGDDFIDIETVNSWDPNDKIGLIGYGANRYINKKSTLSYIINFENIDSASAPAQEVFVIDTLDLSKFDLSTFALNNIKIGNSIISLPKNKRNYNFTYDMRPTQELLVNINATLDPISGICTWKFTSIDPLTGELPEDPLIGFLPPNKVSPEGEGYVSFSIAPLETLGNEIRIENMATIIFDFNPPINTPIWFNTIDTLAPISIISAENTTIDTTNIRLIFTGNDQGSGIKDYSLYYSVDGSEFQLYNNYLDDNIINFTGDYNKTYSFYSISRDKVGNIETKDTNVSDLIIKVNEPINNIVKGTLKYKEIEIFPNPADKVIIFKSNKFSNEFKVEIYNTLGQLILQDKFIKTNGTVELNISSLQTGVFYIKIQIDDTIVSRKFIKCTK